jgi:hypothetical protein
MRVIDNLRRWLWIGLAVCAAANMAVAGTIVIAGQITQSTQDGTGPAVNNPSLNNILDFQPYLVTLAFAGSITGAGTYNLTGGSLTFSDPSAPASESSFGSISLTIAAAGTFDDLTLMACLTTGTSCGAGNQMSLIFQIPAASLNSQNVPATGLDQPHPLDLLEDDGVTDIHGSITSYSSVPEPSPAILLGCALAALAVANGRKGAAAQEDGV